MTTMSDIACVVAGLSPVRMKSALNRKDLNRISAQGRFSGGAELLPVRH